MRLGTYPQGSDPGLSRVSCWLICCALAASAAFAAPAFPQAVESRAAAIAALRDKMQIEAEVHEGAVMFGVPSGEAFLPRLFAELPVPITSVSVARPSLDDVFMSFTGTTIRDAEASAADQTRANPFVRARR